MRFYTTRRYKVEWPFVIANHSFVLSNLLKRKFEHGIFDCSIDAMTKNGEYPRGHITRHTQRSLQLTKVWGPEKVWCTIPDYCDDVHPGICPDNIEKTLQNIEDFLAIDQVAWLPVLQARLHNRLTFAEGTHKFKKIWANPPRLAIGTVCKSRNLKFIEWCCRFARSEFPHAWIHAFGLTLQAIPKVHDVIDSWDSLAWQFLREPYYDGQGVLVRTARGGDRSPHFVAYLDRIRELDPNFEEPNGRSETVVSPHKEEA